MKFNIPKRLTVGGIDYVVNIKDTLNYSGGFGFLSGAIDTMEQFTKVIFMDQKELLKNLYQFVINNLSYEEYHNFGSPDNFHKWVETHYKIIPKSELIPDKEYKGVCRNTSKAIWNGEKFIYKRHKFGTTYNEEINHYEDDDGYDVFVPIEYIGED